MRIIFINQRPIFNLDSTSHPFWISEFQSRASCFQFIDHYTWNPKQIRNFKPDHIHFSNDALPRALWMPIPKIKELRRLCPNTVITSYRGGVGKEKRYLEQLNPLMDAAFGSTDYYKDQIWLPAPSDPAFWSGKRNPRHKIICVSHASEKHVQTMRKRGIKFTKHKTLKMVARHFQLTIVGSGWGQWGLRHNPPTHNYNENKKYYLESFIGLNIIHDDLKVYPKYWSSRLVHMLMSGLPCFTIWQPRIEEVFKHEENIVLYKSNEDLIVKLQKFLKPENRDWLEQIGANGKELASREWNSKVAVDKILSVKHKRKESAIIKHLGYV